jgi:hypothetical protein
VTGRTLAHDPDDPAEVAAIQTPDGQPDGVLIDPETVDFTDESDEISLLPEDWPEDDR